MTIEDGEEIFGARWNLWSTEQRREFASVLEVEDLKYPLYINWALEYLDATSAEVQMFILILQHRRERHNEHDT